MYLSIKLSNELIHLHDKNKIIISLMKCNIMFKLKENKKMAKNNTHKKTKNKNIFLFF